MLNSPEERISTLESEVKFLKERQDEFRVEQESIKQRLLLPRPLTPFERGIVNERIERALATTIAGYFTSSSRNRIIIKIGGIIVALAAFGSLGIQVLRAAGVIK